MKLEGKVSLITGGVRGIGAATVRELAGRGSDIVVMDRELGAEAEALREQVETLGRRIFLAGADLSNPQAILGSVQAAAEWLGRLDVLVHCAGGPANGGLMEVSPEDWYRAFDIHVHAAFHLCRAAVPLMRRCKEGAIVLIASAAGFRGCLGAIAYGVVKGAIPQFARDLARELADDNIRVNAVAPGIIRTRFQDSLTPEQVKNNIERRIPLHREGRPEDVAQAIALLVTNDFITGETVVVDGGMSMRIV